MVILKKVIFFQEFFFIKRHHMQTFYLFIKNVIKISVFHILKNHSAGPLGVKFSMTTQSTFCQYFSLLRIRILKNLRENLEK